MADAASSYAGTANAKDGGKHPKFHLFHPLYQLYRCKDTKLFSDIVSLLIPLFFIIRRERFVGFPDAGAITAVALAVYFNNVWQ
jgi:hypothetical protein